MTRYGPSDTRAPLISLVVSVYNVEEYLDQFLDSLEQVQARTPDDVELIFVIDGSLDSSERRIRDWASQDHLWPIAVASKPNGGLSSARNAGMTLARGAWVSFPDPDDVLTKNYLARIIEMIERHDGAERPAMLAARLVQFSVSTRSPIKPHPLDSRFHYGSRVVDLDLDPSQMHLHSATAFYRTSVITAHRLWFRDDVRPVFEDGVFTLEYLRAAGQATIGLVPSARYFYRKRIDNSSMTGTAWGRPSKYIDVLENGHIRLLRGAGPNPPMWLQFAVLYDLQWYFKQDEAVKSETAGISDELKAACLKNIKTALELCSPHAVVEYGASGVPQHIRLAMLALRDGRVAPATVGFRRLDKRRRIAQLAYYTSSIEPDEIVTQAGARIEPLAAKSRALVFFGRTLLYERILWIPAERPVSVVSDGVRLRVEMHGPTAPTYWAAPDEYWAQLGGRNALERRRRRRAAAGARRRARQSSAVGQGASRKSVLDRARALPRGVLRRARALVGRVTRLNQGGDATHVVRAVPTGFTPAQVASIKARKDSTSVRGRFQGAWVFIDRDTVANDNAEHLYRYVRRAEPDINAWFVLNRDSEDWPRLAKEGFRLVEHNSADHVLLMLHARFLISSQIDEYIVKPYDTKHFGARRFKFVFLQHGVTQNDLSHWFNRKRIDLILAATEAEKEAFVANGTPYKLTNLEVALTGFPRHDRLVQLKADLPEGARRSLLIMPTWRAELLGPVSGRGNLRMPHPEFWSSRYAEQWFGLLRSDNLANLARDKGLEIVFLPHPNLAPHVDTEGLPDHVRVVKFGSADVQAEIVRAAVAITDYSSLAFEAAYAGSPVVYFQFDRDEFFGGSHGFRRGYFSYENHGFGPVCESVAEVEKAVEELLVPETVEALGYAERIRSTFAYHDGRASERAVAAIRGLMRAPKPGA